MKNSSRLEARIERNLTRSRIGFCLILRLFEHAPLKGEQRQFAIYVKTGSVSARSEVSCFAAFPAGIDTVDMWRTDAEFSAIRLPPDARQPKAPLVPEAVQMRGPGRILLMRSTMHILTGVVIGLLAWLLLRFIVMGLYTVDQNERAVKTQLRRAAQRARRQNHARRSHRGVPAARRAGTLRLPAGARDPAGRPVLQDAVGEDPQGLDRDHDHQHGAGSRRPAANEGGTRLEAVTKDQLNTGLTGQIRYRVSESNLYAYLFGIKKPFVHVMGYFVSVLRQRIANFEAKPVAPAAAAVPDPGAARRPDAGSEMTGVSINDLRKNLRDLNEYMDQDAAPRRRGTAWCSTPR